ncbi:hypothetical protein ACOSQ4_025888 [Xanthoceras sorbifolium]
MAIGQGGAEPGTSSRIRLQPHSWNQLMHGKIGLHDEDVWLRAGFFLGEFERGNESGKGPGIADSTFAC